MLRLLSRPIAALFRDAALNWVKDHAQSMGAALAFYTIFSIAPLLLIVIAIAGFVFGEEAARGEIYGQLVGLLGTTGAAAVQELLESVSQRSQSVPRGGGRHDRAVHRRHLGVRRTAGRARPHLARAATVQAGRPVEPGARRGCCPSA